MVNEKMRRRCKILVEHFYNEFLRAVGTPHTLA
jgi:hypothetical protein